MQPFSSGSRSPGIATALGVNPAEVESLLLDSYMDLISDAEDKLPSKERDEKVKEISDHYPGIKLALDQALEQGERGRTRALAAAAVLSVYWFFENMYREGLYWLNKILRANPDGRTSERAVALVGAGLLYRAKGNPAKAKKLLVVGESILRQRVHEMGRGEAQKRLKRHHAFALALLGLTDRDLMQSSRACDNINESLKIFEELNFTWGVALAHYYLGMAEINWAREAHRGKLTSAELEHLSKAVEALTISQGEFDKLGDRWGVMQPLIYLGIAAIQHARYEEARGEYDLARRYFEEARQRFKEYLVQAAEDFDKHRRGIARCFCGLAAIANNQGDPRRAVKLLGVAYVISRPLDVESERVFDDISEYEDTCKEALKKLGSDAKDRAFVAGIKMGARGKVIEYALQDLTTQDFTVVDDFTLAPNAGSTSDIDLHLSTYLEQFRTSLVGVHGVQAVALTVVRDSNISDYVALYVVGDFRWMERGSKREDVEQGHQAYLSIKQAYATFSKRVGELPKGDVSCGFWFLDTKGKGVNAILPTLRQQITGADAYGFNSSEVEIIRGPYVSILGTPQA